MSLLYWNPPVVFLLIQNSTRWPRGPLPSAPLLLAYCHLINLISHRSLPHYKPHYLLSIFQRQQANSLLKAFSCVVHSETFFPHLTPSLISFRTRKKYHFSARPPPGTTTDTGTFYSSLYILFLLGIYLTSHIFYLSVHFLLPLECKITTKGILKNWFITDKSSEPETLPGTQQVLNAYLFNEWTGYTRTLKNSLAQQFFKALLQTGCYHAVSLDLPPKGHD